MPFNTNVHSTRFMNLRSFTPVSLARIWYGEDRTSSKFEQQVEPQLHLITTHPSSPQLSHFSRISFPNFTGSYDATNLQLSISHRPHHPNRMRVRIRSQQGRHSSIPDIMLRQRSSCNINHPQNCQQKTKKSRLHGSDFLRRKVAERDEAEAGC
jgi:hypothetical protein